MNKNRSEKMDDDYYDEEMSKGDTTLFYLIGAALFATWVLAAYGAVTLLDKVGWL